ncbi:MAG: TylF/MycF/NovP-related O-methyltransferase [Candidatus Eiseniibacteriota bacterium]
MKELVRRLVRSLGYDIRRLPSSRSDPGAIPDAGYYDPLFSPWLGYGAFGPLLEHVRPRTLVSADRIFVLYSLARQAIALGGEIWECGVYRGGSAGLLAETIAASCKPGTTPGTPRLRLFDSFAGMKETDAKRDLHQPGDFSDTSLESVRAFVGHSEFVSIHPGWIPDTFAGLEESRIALAHVDVDLYRSVLDSARFILPRMLAGGFVLFDDYGFPSCPGARQAVDEFFADRPERPLVLPTGQALVFVSR